MTTHRLLPSSLLKTKALHRVQESLLAVSSFLKVQEPWMAHMARAGAEGYFVETISLALQHIRIILKKALWLETQLVLLRENTDGHADRTRYLLSLLERPEHLLPRTTPDAELYGAAEKYGLLDAQEGKRLMRIEEEFQVLQRNLFLAKDDHPDILQELARELLTFDRTCMEKLRERHAEGCRMYDYTI